MVAEGSFFIKDEEEEDPEERIPATPSEDGLPLHPLSDLIAAPVPLPPPALPEFIPAFSSYSDFEEEFLSGDSEYEPAPDAIPARGNGSPPPTRPDCVNVLMPHVPLENYANLAYAYIFPPAVSPAFFIRRALNPRPPCPTPQLRPFSQGSSLVIFNSTYDRELAMLNEPFRGYEHTVHLVRHDDTENRFLFDHLNLAGLAIDDFPLKHWFAKHIFASVVPFASPYKINPICITDVDYSAVLITVKACSINDVPHMLAFYCFFGIGTLANIDIVHSQALPPIHDNPFPPRSPRGSVRSDTASDDGDSDDSGGSGPSDPELAMPPPLPKEEPTPSDAAAGPAAAAAPGTERIVNLPGGALSPLVHASPLLSRPADVEVRLFLGFFKLHVTGADGERGLYRLPLERVGEMGMFVANLATCSMSPPRGCHERSLATEVDIICRDPAFTPPVSAVEHVQPVAAPPVDARFLHPPAPRS
ncbi:hypothetical protein BRADI_3g09532v3 [Brachypodium distachyon]|uniref:DUF4283 domain-containing protein n=1 Tax=Brachypodium distachyon TaxID=15368 RepID=A0A2K2CW75_BRADI|nr:hypothetical protein BRADI_3g09532v3 [Brachypodium distachyon]